MEKKNLVVVGYGGMGSWHASHAKKSDVVNLLGIYDIDPERSKAAVENGIFAYDSLEKVLNDKNVDIITIATPNHLHKDIAIKALDAGINEISEKPVTVCSADLEEMIAAAKKSGKLFTVHQNRRWDNEILAVEEFYQNGELGQVYDIESRVHGSRGIPGDWRKVKKYGGGMVLDWGVHLIDQALQVVKDVEIVSINARLDYITNDECDDGCHIELIFKNGVRFFIEVGTNNFISLPRFYMLGTNGSAIINNWGNPIKVVNCKNWYEENILPIKAASGITKTMAPRDEKTIKTYEKPLPVSDVHDFYRNFCRAIDGKEPQLITHTEMRRVMKVMEAAFESNEKGMTLKVSI